MDEKVNVIYKNLLEKLKELTNSSPSLNEVQLFLSEVDSIICNMFFKEFDKEFLLPFYHLLERKIGNSTFGQELIYGYLSNREKLPPSLLIYFYMKKKNDMGFSNTYNKFKIDFRGIAYTDHYEDKYICFNFNFHNNKYPSNEEYNYQCMENIMHEIIHIYQFSINPNSENIYDQIIYNDRRLWEISNETEIMNYNAMHDDYLIEHQANVWSRHFMLNFAKENPQYFTDEFVASKESEFLSKLNRNAYYGGQRYAFTNIMNMFFEWGPQILETDEQKKNFEEGKIKIIELINKDIVLRNTLKMNPDVQELCRHIYLGFEPYSLDDIKQIMLSSKKNVIK